MLGVRSVNRWVASAARFRSQVVREGRSMSDPRFTQPWHDVPRDEIRWFPTIEPELCNGCGLCSTSCGRAVFRYDYDARRAVVVAPVQCMVGCTTCANICPSVAISFQSQSSLKDRPGATRHGTRVRCAQTYVVPTAVRMTGRDAHLRSLGTALEGPAVNVLAVRRPNVGRRALC